MLAAWVWDACHVGFLLIVPLLGVPDLTCFILLARVFGSWSDFLNQNHGYNDSVTFIRFVAFFRFPTLLGWSRPMFINAQSCRVISPLTALHIKTSVKTKLFAKSVGIVLGSQVHSSCSCSVRIGLQRRGTYMRLALAWLLERTARRWRKQTSADWSVNRRAAILVVKRHLIRYLISSFSVIRCFDCIHVVCHHMHSRLREPLLSALQMAQQHGLRGWVKMWSYRDQNREGYVSSSIQSDSQRKGSILNANIQPSIIPAR